MKIIGIIIVGLIIIGGGWYFSQGTPPVENTPAAVNEGTGVGSTMPAMNQEVEVVYSDTGFSAPTVTIPVGSKVTWKNTSKVDMWVASAMHPTHSAYEGTNMSAHCKDGVATSAEVFDQCAAVKPGESWSFTFMKVGDWKYHDHLTTGRFGSVVVTDAGPAVDDEDAAAL